MAGPFYLLEPRGAPALFSVVIPIYNEQDVLPLLRERMAKVLAQTGVAWELILVNDGSSDRSLEILWNWAKEDLRVKVLGLARNFGHQAAVTAGLDASAGEATVVMDADLQDPPEVILEMLSRYREGYDVVYGQRRSRNGESWFKRSTAWAFYRFMRAFVHPDLPADVGDFRLISRRCLDALKSMRETHRFLRGMVAWVGFAQCAVQYDRSPRAKGQSKYPLRKMIRFALTAAVSFSALPLRASLALGLLVAAIGVLGFFYSVGAKLFGLYTIPGWTSQMALLCILGGGILFSNGIIGEYIARIYEQSKDRPLYIVGPSINFTATPKATDANVQPVQPSVTP